MPKPGKRGKGPPFVALPYSMINGAAYQALSASAAKALPYFLGKVKLGFNHPDRTRASFSLTYTEAARYGFAKATFSRVLRDLIACGFLDPLEKGGLRGAGRSNSTFCLSSRWQDYDKPGFVTVRWEGFI